MLTQLNVKEGLKTYGTRDYKAFRLMLKNINVRRQ